MVTKTSFGFILRFPQHLVNHIFSLLSLERRFSFSRRNNSRKVFRPFGNFTTPFFLLSYVGLLVFDFKTILNSFEIRTNLLKWETNIMSNLSTLILILIR